MKYLLNAEQIKAADSYTISKLGVPSLELMERAAAACVDFLEKARWDTSRVCIVCGSGNNGGDGFAIGRILLEKGIPVTMVFAGKEESRTKENACQASRFLDAGGLILDRFLPQEYSLVIDAVFGAGLSREIKGSYLEMIRGMNASAGKKLAVDIPSGVSASTGNILGEAFRADATVTFQEWKFGLAVYPGCEYAGEVVTADVGIDTSGARKDPGTAYTIDPGDAGGMLPERKKDSNKGTFGRVLLVAGSRGMAGAAYLCAHAAYMAGAGLVQIYTAEENRTILQQLIPEAIVAGYREFDREELAGKLDWANVVCVGPGMGLSDTSEKLLKFILNQGKVPCMIDADGINLLSRNRELLDRLGEGEYVLTPHMKELSRLTGLSVDALKADRKSALDQFVERCRATLVQKDARTLVGGWGRSVYVNRSGNPAMAKAGSGDVLAGMITGLMAQGKDCYDAAVLGVYLHGLAGDAAARELGGYSVLARDLIRHIPSAIRIIENGRTEQER